MYVEEDLSVSFKIVHSENLMRARSSSVAGINRSSDPSIE